jgi:hypothetical protein
MLGIPLQEFESAWRSWVMILDADDLPGVVEEKSAKFLGDSKK